MTTTQGVGVLNPYDDTGAFADPLFDRPTIDEVEGVQSRLRVLSVQGLCVAIVDRPVDWQAAAHDLEQVMSGRQSPNGSLLLAPGDGQELPAPLRHQLANLGISVRRAHTDDLVAAAIDLLHVFWHRHRATLARYQVAHAQEGWLR